jgi:hypothetical protein
VNILHTLRTHVNYNDIERTLVPAKQKLLPQNKHEYQALGTTRHPPTRHHLRIA